MGKVVFVGVTIQGAFSNTGTTGVGEAEDFGDFVKTFTDGVIAGGADNFEMIVAGHIDNLSVPARDDKGKKGERRIV